MKAKKYKDVRNVNLEAIPISIPQLHSFWSTEGGFVRGSSVFCTGTSGGGKTSLAFWLQQILPFDTYFYSREMLAGVVKKQMKRFNHNNESAYIADRTIVATFDEFIKEIYELKPQLVILDSIQVIMDEDLCEMSEFKAALYVINKIRTWSEDTKGTAIVIGQLNKEGEFAGSAKIKFMFDAHLQLTYLEKTDERTMKWSKNRFGKKQTLYYLLNGPDIDLFDEDQWLAAREKLTLTKVVNRTITSYTSLLKRNSPNYSNFKKEYAKQMEVHVNKGLTGILLTVKAIELIQQLIVKFDLKAY